MILKKRVSIQIIAILIFSIFSGLLSPSLHADPISAFHANSNVLGDSEIIPGKVIVKYKNIRSLSNSSSIQSISPKIYTLSFANDISVSDKINELQKDPNVEYVEPVYKVHFADTPEPKSITEAIYTSLDNTYMQNWGKTVTGITYAYTNGLTNETNNSHVVVAVIDSGVDLTHLDLAGAIVPGYDFVHNTSQVIDDNGHGTNVAGIIAAKSHDGVGVNATGYTGVAPGTKIMPIKVMDSNGIGDTSVIVQGIQLAISTRTNSNYPV
ncbi:MAG: extracellular peptidase family, partial [Bacilli bacterium]|nr:extracellular peptidase family [Bacilli bacterium]